MLMENKKMGGKRCSNCIDGLSVVIRGIKAENEQLKEFKKVTIEVIESRMILAKNLQIKAQEQECDTEIMKKIYEIIFDMYKDQLESLGMVYRSLYYGDPRERTLSELQEKAIKEVKEG